MQRWNQDTPTAGAVLGAILIVGLAFPPTAATAEVWRFARGPSSVEFTVGHLIFTTVTGRFSRFDGTVRCPDDSSGDDFAGATVDVTIDVGSVYTGHVDRDRHLLAEDFFAAERFPQMRFESRSVERTGPETYLLVGGLTIRGVTHDVEFEAFYAGERETARGKRRDFRATGSINRSDYGIIWNQTWTGRCPGRSPELIGPSRLTAIQRPDSKKGLRFSANRGSLAHSPGFVARGRGLLKKLSETGRRDRGLRRRSPG